MSKKIFFRMGVVGMLAYFCLFYCLFQSTTKYRSEGLKEPNAVYSIPNNEHGDIIYITQQQNKNINVLFGSLIICGLLNIIFLCKGGIPFGGVGLGDKKKK